jgi:hypothetical protein
VDAVLDRSPTHERHFPKNLIFYRGPSCITGEPVIAVAGRETSNPKTGPAVQVWILHQHQSPIAAVKSGADQAICGDCPHRGDGYGNGRSCYVEYFRAPFNLWRALPRTGLDVSVEDLSVKLKGKHLRLGAYGDPAAVPVGVWRRVLQHATGWTAYTHQWRHCDPEFRWIAMASVEDELEQQTAESFGWRTFRVRTVDEPLTRNEIVCPASTEGGHVAQCASCGLCCGSRRNAKSIAIVAHGSGASHFVTRKLTARPIALTTAQ